MTDRYWWPLAQSGDLDIIFDRASADLGIAQILFDANSAATADRLTISTLKSGLPRILDKDTLPSLCHLFVGWGDALHDGRRLSPLIGDYVQYDDSGNPFIYQAHGEGDFHPWQTFCYMIMGGMPIDQSLTARSSLRTVARGSTTIATQAMEDLGHLLFSLAHMDLDDSIVFRFRQGRRGAPIELDLFGMIAEAMRAHHFGTFQVCRKFHLTEGLCAVASRIDGLERLRPIAQGFFAGQMDILVLMYRILTLAEQPERMSEADRDEVQRLRDALSIGSLFENHFYYVGHLVELACFGLRFGFEMTPTQRNAATACLNICNGLIGRFAGGLARAEVLLPFSHYRRGLTLWPSASAGIVEPLDRFTADFDAIDALPHGGPNASPVFTFASETDQPREVFQAVLAKYACAYPELPPAKGSIRHFRRINPDRWPRQLHYEFLDYGNRVGAELHFENAALVDLLPSVRDSVATLVSALNADSRFEFYFDDGNAAKLALVFDDSAADPGRVVDAMVELIRATDATLEHQIRAG